MRSIAVLLVASGVAHADFPVDRSGPFPDEATHVEAGLALELGGVAFGPDQHMAGGLRGELGLHHDRLAMAVDYAWLWGIDGQSGPSTPSVQDPMPQDPPMRWLSANRWTIDGRYVATEWREEARGKHSHKLYAYHRGELWFGAGIGRETTRWHDVTTTSDAHMLALAEIGLSESARDPGQHVTVDLRLTLARVELAEGRVAHELTFGWMIAFGN